MALTNDEKTAAGKMASDIAEIAAILYGELLDAKVRDGLNFTTPQAFDLTKILLTYAVNEVDEACDGE